MKKLWKNYNLSIVLTILFVASLLAQAVFQWTHVLSEAEMHGQQVTFNDFLPQFLSSMFENWQSEFLQLLTFVILTSFLVHKGSHESKDSDEKMERQLDRIEKLLEKRR